MRKQFKGGFMKQRKLYILSGLIMFLCMGTIYSWSVFRGPLVKELELLTGTHISATMAQMPYTIFLLFYSFTMHFSGKLIKKIDPRILCISGSLLVGLAWILAGNSREITHIMWTYGVIGGIGVGIVYGVPIAVVTEWFPHKKGLAVGLTLMGFGMSPLITAPLANYLILKIGVFNAFRDMGFMFAIVLSLLSLLFQFPKEKIEVHRLSEKEIEFTTKEMLKTKTFYALWINFIIGAFIGLMMVGIAKIYAQETIGLSSGTATILLSFFAIFNGVGRPIFGNFVDKFGTKKTIYLSYLLIIIGALLQLYFREIKLLYVLGYLLFFLNLGGWLAIIPAANISLFGREYSTQNYGLLFTAYGIGALIQGFLGGYIREAFGSYVYVFIPVIIACIIGIVINFLFIKEQN